jgi:hypothetical protein
MSEQEKIKTNKIPKILRKMTSFYPFFFKGAKVFLCPGAKKNHSTFVPVDFNIFDSHPPFLNGFL